MIGGIYEDVEIVHADGKTRVLGMPKDDLVEFAKQTRASGDRSGQLRFRGVTGATTLRPDGTPNQTIIGEENEQR